MKYVEQIVVFKFTKTTIFLLIFAFSAFAQNSAAVPGKLETEIETSAEVREALKDFDFYRLAINPNNLSQKDIENLKNNFYPEAKPYLIDKGDCVDRLARIAKPIFLFHKAGKSQIAVFDHRAPAVFTWKETFLTFSTGALDILTDDEIAALVAHEIGHLYYAESLAKARADKNDRQTRVIELECDLVALVTLSKLKINPSDLISAVGKMIEKRTELKINSFQAGSPALRDREEILAAYLKKIRR